MLKRMAVILLIAVGVVALVVGDSGFGTSVFLTALLGLFLLP